MRNDGGHEQQQDPGNGGRLPGDAEPEEGSGTGLGDAGGVAGAGVRQPETAEGPVPGLQPGEEVERGPRHP
ncbi:hypothetical protein C0036_22590, partial [Streptomyces sp. DJ]